MEQNKTEQLHHEVGIVKSTKGYLLSLEGLPSAKIDNLLTTKDGARALVTSLLDDRVEALLLDQAMIKPGDRFFLRSEQNIFSFGEHLFGRVINALGNYIDNKRGTSEPNAPLELNVVAKGVHYRDAIKRQFPTGIMLVDTLFPIGKGQRQLIFGPIRSGKTTFLQDVVVNQRDTNTVCIYTSIGKPIEDVRKATSGIFKDGGNKNTIVVSAASNEPAPLIAIAPSVAFSIAEHFSAKGLDVLLILDDLGTHAKYLREIGLLQGRLPGRESYPGDIFYQHAHLMERSGQFNKNAGGGSITLLPILETDIKNNTDLIPTNLMASTDGHFSLSATLRAQGYYPTIMPDKAVTRVGRNTQSLVQKQLATQILTSLAEYSAQEEYSRFGAQVSSKTQETLHRGDVLHELLNQDPFGKILPETQAIVLGLAFTPFLMERSLAFIKKNKKIIIATAHTHKNLAPVREMALQDKPLQEFMQALTAELRIFETACQ